MFQGFSQEALDFLFGIRMNNSKEWFEPRKKIYTEKIYEPMKALGEELFRPFEKTEMMYKVGRIYRDESFPPYLHYRDTIWIYIRYPAWYWNKTPTLFFELSPEGAEFGFRIAKPDAAVMERFRAHITGDGGEFFSLVNQLRREGIVFGGEEYKRLKKCTVPEAEEFFRKKGLSASVVVADPAELNSPALAERVISTFKAVLPLNELFHELVDIEEAAKAILKESAIEEQSEPEPPAVKAPRQDFMW